jgi:endoglucanase
VRYVSAYTAWGRPSTKGEIVQGTSIWRLIGAAAAVTVLVAVLPLVAAGATVDKGLAATTQFLVPLPSDGAVQQGLSLLAHRDIRNALLIARMEAVPRSVWLTGGTAAEVTKQIRQSLALADLERAVPSFVVYNIPGRDCGSYSAGGAQSTSAYEAYVDAVSAAIGSHKAVITLEPDALANLPSDCGYPASANPAQLTADRYTQINYAVDKLEAGAKTSVYLDAGHSHWHSVGDMAVRLVQGGVLRSQGFFLNVSNFRPTDYEVHFGTWISQCIAFANDTEEGGWRLGHYDWCASQYYSPNGAVDPNDISTWHWTDDWYTGNLGHAVATTHFLVDTSRNGQGWWNPPSGVYSDPQDWCNPPGRGLGARPTANTGNPLVDAFLWVKTPGESDGACTRGAPAGSADPEWHQVDPAAGAWFAAQALQLAQLASPPLAP